MSLITRILCKQHAALSQQCRPERLGMIIFATNKSTGSAQHQMDEFWLKNKSANRPLSPHLTIYKPQLTSMLSITHRATGIGLAGLTCGFAFMTLLPDAATDQIIIAMQGLHSSWLGSAFLLDFKLLVAWPIMFHTINGLRHLMWDRASGLKMSEVYQSGWLVLVLSMVLALLFVLPWNTKSQQ